MPYIDRDRLMELSQDVLTFDYETKSFGYFSGVSDEDIAKIPTADVEEVKHGKWLKTDAYPHHVYCSLCYRDYVTNEEVIQGRKEWQPPAYCTEAEYCPHCGAKMDGERKNTGKKQ